MIRDCIVVHPLTEVPIGSESDFVESDVVMDESDEADALERMEGLMVHSQ